MIGAQRIFTLLCCLSKLRPPLGKDMVGTIVCIHIRQTVPNISEFYEFACNTRNVFLVRHIIRDPRIITKRQTLLYEVCAANTPKILSVLFLSCGPFVPNKRCITIVCKYGGLDCVKTILKHNGDPTLVFQQSVWHKRIDIVDYLFKNGYDIPEKVIETMIENTQNVRGINLIHTELNKRLK